jgi:hypothetical protein
MTTEATAPAAAQKVFICYRREETAPYAGRIYDAMVAKFGVENVFMDLDLAPGVDFVERITRVVSGCVALIVVIGPKWARLENEDGSRRIADPDDFVRLEVETGLQRDDVLLVPALVGGARMPRREELPSELQTLARRNALELSEGRWRYDVGRLLDTLDELLPESAGSKEATPPPPPIPEPAPPDLGWRLVLEGMLLTAVTAVVARVLAQAIYDAPEKGWRWTAVQAGETVPDKESWPEQRSHIAEVVGWRTLTFAAIGVALAIWLGLRIWHRYTSRSVLRGLSIGALAGVLSGVICAVLVYLPDETVPLDSRTRLDLVSFAAAGAVVGSLIGWFWKPPRMGRAVLAGAAGGFLGQGLIVITSWQSTSALVNGLKFAVVAAVTVGVALVAMLLADRTEAGGTQAAVGSPRSGANHSDGSTGGILPG